LHSVAGFAALYYSANRICGAICEIFYFSIFNGKANIIQLFDLGFDIVCIFFYFRLKYVRLHCFYNRFSHFIFLEIEMHPHLLLIVVKIALLNVHGTCPEH